MVIKSFHLVTIALWYYFRNLKWSLHYGNFWNLSIFQFCLFFCAIYKLSQGWAIAVVAIYDTMQFFWIWIFGIEFEFYVY